MRTNVNKAFSDWYDTEPTQPTYQETFEAGQRHGIQDSEMMQAITDPENQPSQFGTVTLAMYQQLEAELESARETVKASVLANSFLLEDFVRRPNEVNQELMEALKHLLEDTQHAEHEDCEDGPCPVREARAAIAKATGGKS